MADNPNAVPERQFLQLTMRFGISSVMMAAASSTGLLGFTDY